MAAFANHEFLEYLVTVIKEFEAGGLEQFSDPSYPDGLDEELTPQEKNFVKILYKEIRERFNGSGL